MKEVTIDLAGPFEEIVANLRSIPPTDNLNGSKDAVASELSPEVYEVAQSIYEAARGRQFATLIGLVPAGPLPIAPFLKDAPYKVASQADFLLQTLARLYCGSYSKTETPPREACRKIKNPRVEFQTSGSSRAEHESLSPPLTYDDNYDEPAYSHHHASLKSERFSATLCPQENHARHALRE
jgi:hypothetical protein